MHADEIALTDSTTMALALLYGGLRLQEDDEVLTTTHDFYSTHESLRLRALRTSAHVRKIRPYQNARTASVDEIRPRWLHGSYRQSSGLDRNCAGAT